MERLKSMKAEMKAKMEEAQIKMEKRFEEENSVPPRRTSVT